MKLKLSLQTILFLAFGVVAVVPVLSLSLWIQSTAYIRVVEQVEDKHLLLAKHLSSTIDRHILGLQYFLKSSLFYNHASQEANHSYLVAFDGSFKRLGIKNISEIEAVKGHITIFGDEKLNPAIGVEKAADLMVNNKPAHAPLASQVLMSQGGQPLLYFLFNDKNARYIVALSTDFITELQQSIQFGRAGHAAIVDALGNVIAHPNTQWQQSIKNISSVAPVAEMMKGNSGVSQFYSPALHDDMISGYTIVKETGWGVMVPQPISELKAEAENSRRNSLVIAALGLFIAFIIAYLLTKYLSKPIKTVLDSLRDLSQGDKVSPPVKNTSIIQVKERNELIKRFYMSANNLEKFQENLAALVEERTSELREEINERKKIEEEMRHLATHDFLTGLPNRALFIDRFSDTYHALKQKDKDDSSCKHCGLLFLDLDNFKQVNDKYSHLLGDKLLKLVTERIVGCVTQTDTVARQSGDEFIILLTQVISNDALQQLAQKIIGTIEVPYIIDDKVIAIGVSIGGIIIDKKIALTPEEIIQKADILMYESKRKGGNSFTIYNDKKSNLVMS